jgi:hypothetical protein
MEVHEHKSNLEGWRRFLDPFRPSDESAEPSGLKDRWLIGAVLVGIWVVTPAWIFLTGWLAMRFVFWLFGV